MHFIAVATSENKKHADWIVKNSTYDPDNNLEAPPKLRKLYKWVEDKEEFVSTMIKFFKLTHKEECSTKDYIPVVPHHRDNKEALKDYKFGIKCTVIKSIEECKRKLNHV